MSPWNNSFSGTDCVGRAITPTLCRQVFLWEKKMSEFNLLSLPLSPSCPSEHEKKKKYLEQDGDLTNSWGLFMVNTSHSMHLEYLCLSSCGCDHVIAGYWNFLSPVFSSLIHSSIYVLSLHPLVSVFSPHPFLCVSTQTKDVAKIVFKHDCNFWSGPLLFDLSRGGGDVRVRTGISEEEKGLEKEPIKVFKKKTKIGMNIINQIKMAKTKYYLLMEGCLGYKDWHGLKKKESISC